MIQTTLNNRELLIVDVPEESINIEVSYKEPSKVVLLINQNSKS